MDSVSNTILCTFLHDRTEGQDSPFYTKTDQIVSLMDSNATHETCRDVRTKHKKTQINRTVFSLTGGIESNM
jgi:hypothetical protein